MQLGGHLESGETLVEHLLAETRIERAVDFDERLERHVGKIVLLGHDEHLAQRLRHALLTWHSIDGDLARLRVEQSRNEIEQGALTRSVLAQQTIDAILLE